MELCGKKSVIDGCVPFIVSDNYLQETGRAQGKWSQTSLPPEIGDTEFTTCRICDDITLTGSSCTFNDHYLSCIRYQKNTTLLIFGFEGVSSIGFSKNDINYLIRPGDVWLVNTGGSKLFRYTPSKQKNEMVVIKYATKRVGFAFPNKSRIFSDNGTPWLMRLGYQEANESWISDLMGNPFNTALDCLSAEAKTLDVLARWLRPLAELAPDDTPVAKKSSEMDKIINLMTADLANVPSLEEMSRIVGMSHSRLNRTFKKTFGKTVFGWLRDYRLARARSLLKDKQRSITDIAFLCGFSSASHFAQTFKQRYSCTPIEFRNNEKLQEVYCEYGIS
ncbi:helix-turn-helix domain-containing protein [Microbulbifer variabilis]|jgi:AraC family transcriptional regulator|uniref:AraC family transcriptional regulator n=1 Tax=Microbulbifer variabilis TaxID=266805 RepID=A0ABY4VDT7_9GAMM|nr:AraC family transcriptional regulator [Microbulbifer variabilis]USD22411.1 AraC family transcriptional regulator [Microbulbifer variabilis]